MKKIIILLVILIFFTSCNSNKVSKTVKVEETKPTILDYFPLINDKVKEYKGGFEDSGEIRYTEFIKNNKIQMKIISSATNTVAIYEVTEDSLVLLDTLEEMYSRYNFLNECNGTKKEILIKSPLEEGNTWILNDNRQRTISSVRKKVTTSFGELDALEITTIGKNYKTKDYYVKGMGHVKTIFIVNGEEQFITELSKLKQDEPVTVSIKLYSPIDMIEKVDIKEQTIKIEVNTNVETATIFEIILREQPFNNSISLIGEETRINEIIFNRVSDEVIIDFSSCFFDYIKNNIQNKDKIIQCITNTLKSYFRVNKIVILLDGKNFESKEFLIKN